MFVPTIVSNNDRLLGLFRKLGLIHIIFNSIQIVIPIYIMIVMIVIVLPKYYVDNFEVRLCILLNLINECMFRNSSVPTSFLFRLIITKYQNSQIFSTDDIVNMRKFIMAGDIINFLALICTYFVSFIRISDHYQQITNEVYGIIYIICVIIIEPLIFIVMTIFDIMLYSKIKKIYDSICIVEMG